MRPHLGVGIGSGALRIVLVRRGRVVWFREVPLEPGAELEDALAGALDEVPRTRWLRPDVAVAVGPRWAQVKVVRGLPPVAEETTLSAIIRESPATFFRRNGRPLVTARVLVLEPGCAVAAAVEEGLLSMLRSLCRDRGYRLRTIVPAAVAVTRATGEERLSWMDGSVRLDIRTTPSGPAEIRAGFTQETATASSPTPLPALAAVGPASWRLADAFGATSVEPDAPLTLGPDPTTGRPARKHRALGPLLIGLLGLVMGLLSPMAGTVVAWTAQRDARRQAQAAVRAREDLLHAKLVASALAEVARQEEGWALVRFLGELARAMPAGSTITSFEGADGQVRITLLAEDRPAVLAVVDSLGGLEPAEVSDTEAVAQAGGRRSLTIRLRLMPPIVSQTGHGSR